MKILQINAVNKLNSTGRTTHELALVLTQQGHNVYNAHSTGPIDEFSYVIGNKIDHKLHAILSRLTGQQAYFSRHVTHKLINFIDQQSFDIVHLRNLHSNYICLPILLKYLAQNDIATVVTLHDCWFYTGKCMHYTVKSCYKWQQQCDDCPQLEEGNISYFFDKTRKMLNEKKNLFNTIPRLAVIGVSDWITNEARKSILKDATIIKRIYNWIDTDVFKHVDTTIVSHKLNLDDKFIILGVASGWSNEKGLDKFVELSRDISTNMVIVLVGNLPADIILPKNIMGIKATNSVEELVKYYSMADVFVNMSKEETFGKVTAEALACGTPIITNNCTANPELVNEKCGIVLEYMSSNNVLNAINHIKEYGKEFYASNCINYAISSFEKNKLINEYLELYNYLNEK
jgi:glycosyltransferase involved in cell wall biosynthesis